MWCDLSGEVKHKNMDLPAELISQIGHRKEIRMLPFQVLALCFPH